jgi:hypothetical protein
MTIDTEAVPGQPSAELIHKITEFANKLAWKQPDLTVLKPEFSGQYPLVAEAMQLHIKASDWPKRLVLPDLRAFNNETVAIFTDYGGESKKAKFLTYSTLVCGWNLTHRFLEMMEIVRHQHGLGTKEIAFKDFRMGQVQRSLPGYLTALDMVPGFLFTLAIDKRLTSLFGPQGKETRELIARALAEAGLGERKPEVNEKLLRVVHVAAFLAGLLAHDGQKLFWMTDHDAISPTCEMHEKTLTLFQRVLGLYARKGYSFPLMGAALPLEERSLIMLDLLSATDIVAGSLDQYMSQMQSVPIADIKVKQGCDLVLQWLTRDGIGLKKMNVIIRPGQKTAIEAATLEFNLKNPPQGSTFIPVSM